MKKPPKMDWSRVDALTDVEIDAAIESDPDTFALDEAFWENAEIVMPVAQPVRQQVTVKLDPRIVSFFKKGGRGFNTRLNAVLLSYVQKMES